MPAMLRAKGFIKSWECDAILPPLNATTMNQILCTVLSDGDILFDAVN